MERAVKRDICKRLEKVGKKYSAAVDRTGCYECSQCGNVTRTRQTVDGVVPMGIECPYCHADAYFIDEDNEKIPVTYEWYRPGKDELLSIADGKLFTVNFVLSGGLLRRKCLKD